MPSIHFLCIGCEGRLAAEAGTPGGVICQRCGRSHGAAAPPAERPVESCAACGGSELYLQKDFNRRTGVALVVLGAVFVPWTYALSLVAVTIVDFLLYYKLREVTVCYACQAVHRGYPSNPHHKQFDLVIHDRHVYGAAPPGAEEAHR